MLSAPTEQAGRLPARPAPAPAPAPFAPPSSLPDRGNRLSPCRARAGLLLTAPSSAGRQRRCGLVTGLARRQLSQAVRGGGGVRLLGRLLPQRRRRRAARAAPPGNVNRRRPRVSSGAGPEAAVCCGGGRHGVREV